MEKGLEYRLRQTGTGVRRRPLPDSARLVPSFYPARPAMRHHGRTHVHRRLSKSEHRAVASGSYEYAPRDRYLQRHTLTHMQ